MTFAEVLPALAAGDWVRRAAWPAKRHCERKGDGPLDVFFDHNGGFVCTVDLADLLASDWELVEEPVTQCSNSDLRERIRERDATIARLERELAEAKRAHFPSCRYGGCMTRRQNAAMGGQ